MGVDKDRPKLRFKAAAFDPPRLDPIVQDGIQIRCAFKAIAPLSEIQKRLNPDNTNEHPQDQVDELVEQYKYQGVRHPIILSTKDGRVMAGEGRFLAAKQLGMSAFPVDWQDFDSLDQQEAFGVADNALQLRSKLNLSKVNLLLPKFDGSSFDIARLGIKDFQVDIADKDKDQDADAVPEALPKAHVRPGDLFILGNHRLLCGDSTRNEDVARLMNGEKADMVFTDPPYGVSYTDKNEYLNSLGKAMSAPKAIENDSRTVPEMFELWKSVFNTTAENCHDRASYYICSPQGGELMMMMMMQAIDQSPWALKHTLIWNKNNHVLGRCDYHYKHEPILYGWKKKGVHDFYGEGAQTKSVWDVPKPHNSDLHPTMKPIELMENALKNSTKSGATVLDIFLGSGSTLIACEKTNRKCYGMEIDPIYCGVILDRWAKFTGKEPNREDGVAWSAIKKRNE